MFPHHPVCKDEGYQKFLTLAVISKSEVDAFTQQPLNTMSEGDAISLSNASLQLTHRDSLNVESSSTASEISQDEIQNAKRKGNPGCRLYKGDHLFEPELENLIYSSLIKKNPCFVTEQLFFREDNFNLTGKAASHEENMTATEQHVDCAENLKDISPVSLDENIEYIRALMKSNRLMKENIKSNLLHCCNKEESVGGSLLSESGACISEKSLFQSSEKSLNGQEECKQGDRGILPSYSTRSHCLSPYEASFNMYETKNSEVGPEKWLFQVGDVDLNEVIKGLEQDQQMQQTQIMDLQYDNIFLEKKIKEIEKLLLEEGSMDLDEVMKKVEQDQKKQHTQIMDLYYDNISLETKIKQLEVEIVQQQHFIETINKLKKNIEDLIEAKDKITVEKTETDSCLKNVQEALSSARDHLEEAGAERKALLLQLEKLKTDYSLLQEKHEAEMEQKTKSTTQCLQMDQTIRRKEQEIQELRHLKQKLDHEAKTATSTLHRLREEKENAEKQLLSLQAELQRQKDDWLAERQQLESRYNKLVAQIKILQTESENERAETEKMQQRISAFKIENQELQQQEQMQYQMIQRLGHKIGIQKEELRKKEEEIEWKMHILRRFLLDMKSMHSDLIQKNLHSEEDHFSSPYVQRASQLLSKIRSLLSLTEGLLTCQDMDSTIEYSKKSEIITELGEKMKNVTLKKKTLEKEITKLENHLALKEEECKRLTGENEKLKGDLGSLTCKGQDVQKSNGNNVDTKEQKMKYSLYHCQSSSSSLVAAQDATEDEEAVEDTVVEDEDDEAEVEEDEPTDLVDVHRFLFQSIRLNSFFKLEIEEKEEEDLSGEPKASPSADTTILFVKGEDFPANNIVKFLVGFTNKGTEDFIIESLDASFRYPQDYQFFIQNFTALPLNTVVPPQRQATFEYSFIPAEPMGGRPFGLVINLNYKDLNGNVFQDAVFNQTVTIIEKEDGLDGETNNITISDRIAFITFLFDIQVLSRKRPAQKVEMGTSNQNDVDMSWIPQETLNQISK
ncbi:Translocon-associated protein subunit alpha [Chelonia mydas]|uniref:Translocon-associated protein subunit alpha n=1 Tax=Chelonia mydas TaxID=8469 RepID=M7B1B5_CHEMY|nr:Translocon-associated protein subunit alpha [Chelonia mydas]